MRAEVDGELSERYRRQGHVGLGGEEYLEPGLLADINLVVPEDHRCIHCTNLNERNALARVTMTDKLT